MYFVQTSETNTQASLNIGKWHCDNDCVSIYTIIAPKEEDRNVNFKNCTETLLKRIKNLG